MKSGLYVRAGACATARLAACAVSLFVPTTNDSKVFRGLSTGTVAAGVVGPGGSSKATFSGAVSSAVMASGPDSEEKLTERGLANVLTMAVCNGGRQLLAILS